MVTGSTVPDMTDTGDQCRNVLHIDWEADNAAGYVREDVARCVKTPHGHDGRHKGKDTGGSFPRW